MEVLIITASAILVSLVTELSKRFKIEPKYVALGLSLLVGLGWYLYQTYMPSAIQLNISALVLGTASGSVAVYEFITKQIKK